MLLNSRYTESQLRLCKRFVEPCSRRENLVVPQNLVGILKGRTCEEPDTYLMFADGDKIIDASIEPDIKASRPLKVTTFDGMPTSTCTSVY